MLGKEQTTSPDRTSPRTGDLLKNLKKSNTSSLTSSPLSSKASIGFNRLLRMDDIPAQDAIGDEDLEQLQQVNELNAEEQRQRQIEDLTIEESERLDREQIKRRRAQQLKSKRKKAFGMLHNVNFALMFLVAIMFDLIEFGLDLALPVMGGVIIAIVITPIAFLTFWLWSKLAGISITKGRRKYILIIVLFVGFLPVFNALPEWIAEILLLKISVVAEYAAAKTSSVVEKAMKSVVGKVRK